MNFSLENKKSASRLKRKDLASDYKKTSGKKWFHRDCPRLTRNEFQFQFANCKCTHGTKSAESNALENSFGLF